MNANHTEGVRSGLGSRQVPMHDLQKAGFTNINIEPEAFGVHAMNSQGEPVLLRITPDAMEAVTAMKDAGSSSLNGNGSHTNMPSNNEHGKTATEQAHHQPALVWLCHDECGGFRGLPHASLNHASPAVIIRR